MKRRNNKEGTYLPQRKDGRFEWKIRFDGKTKSIYAKNKKRLRGKVKVYLTDLENESVIEFYETPFSEYILHYLTKHRSAVLKESTFILYTRIVEAHIKGSVVDKKMKELNEGHLQEFFNIIRRDYSYETVTRLKAIFSSSLGFAFQKRHIKTNPIHLVTMPSKNKCCQSNHKPAQTLTKSEFYELNELVLNNENIDCRLKTLIILLQYTGVRIGEALGLKWRDINFKEKEIHIKRKLKREEVQNKITRTELVLSSPKTEKSNRVIPFNDNLVEALKELKTFQKLEKKNSFGLYKNNDFVFATPVGKAVDPRNELRRLKKFLNEVDFRTDISFHSFRHTYATLLITETGKVAAVSKLLGHSSITTTLNRYTHPHKEDMKEAIKCL